MADVPSRAAALELVHEYTESSSLRKHMIAVEAGMRAYAGNIAQTDRFFRYDPQRLRAEMIDDLIGVDFADTRDETAAQILPNSIDRRGQL